METLLLLYCSHVKIVRFNLPQKQLAEFDAETEAKIKETETDPLSSLQIKHAHARLELREKQLDEMAGSMQELTSEEVYY